MEKPAAVYAPKFELAAKVAKRLREDHGIKPESFDAGIELGSGFGDALTFDKVHANIPMKGISEFMSLSRYDIPHHARTIVIGELGGKLVIAQRGRVHMNEDPDDPATINRMVRLQIELMIHLGIKRLILTAAVGSTGRKESYFRIGEICVVDELITRWAGDLPLYSGEFHNPEICLDKELRAKALAAATEAGLSAKPGRHIMYRGPLFETPHDKRLMAQEGGDVVGMSVLPECCIASLYSLPTVALTCITDAESETPDHEMHVRRLKESSARLGGMITKLVTSL